MTNIQVPLADDIDIITTVSTDTSDDAVPREQPRPILIHKGHGFLGRVYGFVISLPYNQSLTYLPS